MSGYISYPRTETTAYSPNFDFQGALQQLKGSPGFGEEGNCCCCCGGGADGHAYPSLPTSPLMHLFSPSQGPRSPGRWHGQTQRRQGRRYVCVLAREAGLASTRWFSVTPAPLASVRRSPANHAAVPGEGGRPVWRHVAGVRSRLPPLCGDRQPRLQVGFLFTSLSLQTARAPVMQRRRCVSCRAR